MWIFTTWAATLSSCGSAKQAKHRSPPAPRPALAKQSCDLGVDGWRKWFATEIDRFENSQYSLNGAYIAQRMQECASVLAATPDLGMNLGNLQVLTQRMLNLATPGHSLGLSIADAQYLQSSPLSGAQNLPEILNNQDFLKALDIGSFKSGHLEALAWLDQLNQTRPLDQKIIYFLYRSQHLTTIDDSQAFGRLFVYVPGSDADIFLQFGIRDDDQQPLSTSISLIAIVKRDSNGQALTKPKAYYNDLWRLRQDDNISLTTRLKQTGLLESCYGCHSSPLLPIVPDPVFFSQEKFGSALTEVNAAIAKHAHAEADYFDTKDFGPMMGPINPVSRSPEFIKQCAGDMQLASDSIAKIQSAMNCSSCHNDVSRPALRLPMAGFKQLSKDSLVKQYVEVFATMPPGAQLNPMERSAVVRCLSAEYLESSSNRPSLMRQWLNVF